MQKYNARQ